MSEQRSTPSVPEAGQKVRMPFVKPVVQDLGGLTLITLVGSLPGG
ncbi:MAG TPA: hypothetical protein VGB15_21825 [Longimicrobium sp.]|jgi:hypothetical protein